MSGPTFVAPNFAKKVEHETPWPQVGVLMVMRLNALVALLCSGYLAYTAWARGNVLGCSDGGWNCEAVLTSNYSTWFGVPVGFPAFALYGTIFLVLWFCAEEYPRRLREMAWRIVVAASLVAGAAGIWFMGLQAFVLYEICIWCSAVHCCGMVLAACALTAKGSIWRTELVTLVCAMAGVSLLVTGQFFQPERTTFAMSIVEPPEAGETPIEIRDQVVPAPPDEGDPSGQSPRPVDEPGDPDDIFGTKPQPKAQRLNFLGRVIVQTDQFPLIGKPDAEQVLVKLFDYTCPYCRKMHHQLAQLEQVNQGRLAIVLMPVPMNRKCNRIIEETHPIATEACELTRLALAVWQLDREKFDDFHDWLCEMSYSRTAIEARERAIALVGEGKLDEAIESRLVRQQINLGVQLYRVARTGPIPKLIYKDRKFEGRTKDVTQLHEALTGFFALRLTEPPLDVPKQDVPSIFNP